MNDIRPNPKSREISFAHNLFLSYPIVLKFCTEQRRALYTISKWLDHLDGG